MFLILRAPNSTIIQQIVIAGSGQPVRWMKTEVLMDHSTT